LADEVYYGLNYGEGTEFTSFGNLTKEVPIICTSSLSKVYCVPGWRIGWSIVYNNNNYFDKVLDNLNKLAMIQLHPTSVIQYALPGIFKEVKEDYFDSMKKVLKETSEFAFERL
jgi:tyrosine aminotransferase